MSASIAFRYLTRFRCVGPACEEHCCGRWRVSVDEAARDRLAALVPPEALARMIEPGPPEDKGAPFSMRLGDDGDCVMLGADRLCAIQVEHGEGALPEGCAVFPRRAGRVEGRLELTATVACPEIARLALLEDDAMELEEAAPALLPRPAPAPDEGGDAPPYRRHFPLVRSVVLRLLGLADHPLDARLFFVAYLAASIHPFYHAGAREPGFPLGSLHHQLGLVLHPEAQRQLAATLAGVPFDPGVARVLLETIRGLAESASPRLQAMIALALDACDEPGGEVKVEVAGRALHVAIGRLAEIHRARCARTLPDAAARLDAVIERYLTNLAVHAPFVEASDLFLHQQALLIRVALLRFLVLGQPEALASPAALDRAIVAVFSTVTRTFDHDAALTGALHTAIRAMGASSPMHAARIIRFGGRFGGASFDGAGPVT